MTECVGAAFSSHRNFGSIDPTPDGCVEARPAPECSKRCSVADEQLSRRRPRTCLLQICQDRLADLRQQGQVGCPSGLTVPYPDDLLVPIQILQSQASDLTSPHTIPCKQYQNGVITQSLGRAVLASDGQDSLYILRSKRGGNALERVH